MKKKLYKPAYNRINTVTNSDSVIVHKHKCNALQHVPTQTTNRKIKTRVSYRTA